MVFMWWLVVLVMHYALTNILPYLLTDQEKVCILSGKTSLIKGLPLKAVTYGIIIMLFKVNIFCFVIFAIIKSFS